MIITRRAFLIGSIAAPLVGALGIKFWNREDEGVGPPVLIPEDFPYQVTSIMIEQDIIDITAPGDDRYRRLPGLSSYRVEGYGMKEVLMGLTYCWSIDIQDCLGRLVGEFIVVEWGGRIGKFMMISTGEIKYEVIV